MMLSCVVKKSAFLLQNAITCLNKPAFNSCYRKQISRKFIVLLVKNSNHFIQTIAIHYSVLCVPPKGYQSHYVLGYTRDFVLQMINRISRCTGKINSLNIFTIITLKSNVHNIILFYLLVHLSRRLK